VRWLPLALLCALARADELDGALSDPKGDLAPLHRAWLLEHGSYEPLLDELAKREGDAARWVEARTLRARGDTEKALAAFTKLAEAGDADAAAIRARLLEATGKADEAKEAYEKLPDMRLRLALLDEDALAEYGKSLEDPEARRRAAILLGLVGRPAEAAELYESAGTFREEAGLAQWRLAADQPDGARAAAWKALRAAKLSRDRRYALALLVEAYRKDGALDELIATFAERTDLPAEARDAWIDLLRERQRVDEAMRLLAQGSLSTEMRRDLLELCREAGRDELVVKTYRALMADEPRVLAWPAGLARYHLERAERAEAAAVFDGALAGTDDPADVLAYAREAMDLGLDGVAVRAAERAAKHEAVKPEAMLLLFDLYKSRGRMGEAEAQLARLDGALPPDAPARLALAEAHEGMGAKRKAADVLLALRKARGRERSEEDLDMRLAVLLAEVGDDEAALELWRELWNKAASAARRTYIEDRMLTVASRLGTLADIAIELEEKLVAGGASNREAGLLVKIYTRAGDAVSAAEVISEHVKRTGASAKQTLEEKARVYLANADYYNYEQTLHALMEVDPGGKREYLRHLAMSNLERGRPQLARRTLEKLKELDGGRDSAEFEAGVLALAGLEEEAMVAYRRGLARYPDRIEVYLLLAELMVKRAYRDRAVGMFQHLAETAERDDLFTVAIDGLLNVDAPPPVLQWARRVTLARIAQRPDKNYLYQLYSDLSEELRDTPAMIRAGEAALPSAGQRRGAQLRELLELARPRQSNTWVIVGGVAVRQSSGGSTEGQLRFGRRLLHLRELVPPGVYLNLGRAFLAAGDVAAAEQTFRSARDVPDYAAFQRQVAVTFEEAGFLEEARRVYARLLLAEGTDVELLAKVAELHEATGADERAHALHGKAVELMLSRRPPAAVKADDDDDDAWRRYWATNVTEYDQHYDRVLRGVLATLDDPAALLAAEEERIDAELASLEKKEKELGRHPRLRDRARYHRRIAFATGAVARADELDGALLRAFPEDEGLLEALTRERLAWGLHQSARRLVEASGRPEEQRARLAYLFAGGRGRESRGVLAPEEATRLFLPLLLGGETDRARRLLRSVAFSGVSERDLDVAPRLVAVAAFLRDPDATLTFGRHWLAALLRHGQNRDLRQDVMRVFQECFVVLDGPQRVSLARSLADLVVRHPKKAGTVLWTLNQIQSALGEPLFEVEQIEELLEEGGGSMFVYQPQTLVSNVPPADRVDILEELWKKVPKNFRVGFVFNLLQGAREKFSGPVRTFVLARFHEAVEDLDPKRHRYLMQNSLLKKQPNADVALAFAEEIHRRFEDDLFCRACRAAALWNAGEEEKARPLVREIVKEELLGKPDRSLRWPLRRFRTELGAEGDRIAREVLDAAEKKSGPTKETTDARLAMLRQERDHLATLQALERAVETHPDEDSYKSQLASQYAMVGRSVDSLLLLEKLHEKDPKNKQYRRRLVLGWKGLRNEERAKRFEEEEQAPEKEEEPAEKARPATVAEIRKAVEAEDFDAARRLWRRLWRNFQVKRNRFPAFGSWQLTNLLRQTWPKERAPSRRLHRGGIPAKSGDEEEPEPPVPAVLALAEHDFGAAEIERWVRTLDASELDRASLLFDALAKAATRKLGRERAIEKSAQKLRSGHARKSDFAQLLKLLEDQPEPDEASRALLDEIAAAVNVYDYETARRLARVHARTGAKDKAAVLYRWCVTQLHASSDFWSRPDTRKLVEECAEQLEGEARVELVELILRASRPTLQPVWNRDSQAALEIRTWEKVLGAERALEKTRELCEEAAGKPSPLKRQSARAAAALLAAAGERELALRALANAVGRLDPAQVERPRTPYYYSFSASQFRALPLSSSEMLKLFPEGAPLSWCAAAADALERWIADEVMEPRTATRLQALLAARLHAAGAAERARALAEAAERRAEGDPATRVWVLDAWRAIGETGRADALERELLEARCLPLARIPEALSRLPGERREMARERVREYTDLAKLADEG